MKNQKPGLNGTVSAISVILAQTTLIIVAIVKYDSPQEVIRLWWVLLAPLAAVGILYLVLKKLLEKDASN